MKSLFSIQESILLSLSHHGHVVPSLLSLDEQSGKHVNWSLSAVSIWTAIGWPWLSDLRADSQWKEANQPDFPATKLGGQETHKTLALCMSCKVSILIFNSWGWVRAPGSLWGAHCRHSYWDINTQPTGLTSPNKLCCNLVNFWGMCNKKLPFTRYIKMQFFLIVVILQHLPSFNVQ